MIIRMLPPCRVPLRRGAGYLSIIAVLLLMATGLGLAIWHYLPDMSDDGPAIISHVVERGVFENEITERGEVESSSNTEVRCEVKSRNSGGIAILDVVPEGTMVEAGDVLVRLDSSSLDQEKVQQQIICNTTEAQMIEAKNIYEAALIAKTEYIEGTYHQEQQLIKSEILIAEENLRRAREYVAYSKRLAARGYVTSQQLEGDRFAVEIAKTDLDAAKTKLRVLREYTKLKMLKQLDSDIKSSEAKKTSEESSYKLELSKLKEIEDQIENCTIRAPAAGQVVYANKQSSRSGSEFIVEAGAMVRENQAIIRLPDPDTMQVKTQINESRVTMVEAGMLATIRLDAYDAQKLNGEVTRVSEYPEPSSFWSSQVKEYATFVEIIDSPIQIRPGLTAEVTIIADSQNDVLLVPVQSLHEHGPKFYCMVRKKPGWELREIKLISTNDKFAIIEGVEEGEVVAMNPRKLLDRVDLPEIPKEEAPAGPSRAAGRPNADGPDAPGAPGGPDALGGPRAAGPRDDGPSRPGDRPRGPGGPDSGRPGGRGPGEGGPGGGSMDPAAIVSMIFGRLDKDKDGKISTAEIPADQAARMSASDANGDGFIDRAELQKAMAERMSAGGGGPPGGP